MSTNVGNLLGKLKDKQSQRGLSDYKFAKILGVSPQLWQMTRTGKREIGLVVLKAAIRAYPKLFKDVLLFLSSDVNRLTIGVSGSTKSPQTNQNGKCKSFRGWLRELLSRNIEVG